MNRYIFLAIITFFSFNTSSVAQESPKLAIYHTSQILHQKQVDMGVFDDFSLIIFDFENWKNNPESMKSFKEKYPNTKLLAYVNPMEVYYNRIDKRPWNYDLTEKITGLSPREISEYNQFLRKLNDLESESRKSGISENRKKVIFDLIAQTSEEINAIDVLIQKSKYSKWFLWTTKKKHAVFYTKLPYWMMNMTSNCPEVDGLKYNQFIAQYYLEKVFLSDIRPDGIFQDNATADVHWMNGFAFKPENDGWIDSDLDGETDNQESLDAFWKNGQKEFTSIFRSIFGKNFLILGNKGKPEFSPGVYDGKMFEEFPFTYGGEDKRAGGWFQCMKNYFKTGPYSIIQAPQTYNEEVVKFVLCSALLGDGYFAIGHNNYRQFDFYKKIGQPKGAHTEHEDPNVPEKEHYWEREFDGATVKVFPYLRKGEIIYK